MLTVFDKELLANELKTFRRENGLHQNELAEKLGLNRSTVSFFENQKQLPSTEVLNRICDLLGKPAEYFFVQEKEDPVVFMMGKMDESDKDTLAKVIERIKVRKKYISLIKRIGD
jgi:transcriptional regulator with XRE-family HTH domain